MAGLNPSDRPGGPRKPASGRDLRRHPDGLPRDMASAGFRPLFTDGADAADHQQHPCAPFCNDLPALHARCYWRASEQRRRCLRPHRHRRAYRVASHSANRQEGKGARRRLWTVRNRRLPRAAGADQASGRADRGGARDR